MPASVLLCTSHISYPYHDAEIKPSTSRIRLPQRSIIVQYFQRPKHCPDNQHFAMGAFSDVVGSKTSQKRLINLLRGHVSFSPHSIPEHSTPCIFQFNHLYSYWEMTRPNSTVQSCKCMLTTTDGRISRFSPHNFSINRPMVFSSMMLLLSQPCATALTPETHGYVGTYRPG